MIRGKKVSLRPMTYDDIDLFIEWVNSPAAAPYWYGKDRKISREDLLRDWDSHYFDETAPEKGRCFVIEVGSSPVGVICYTDISDDIDRKTYRADVDIIIGKEGNQNKGYGADALRAFASYLFDELGYHRIDIGTYEYNSRMITFLKKVGFEFEGISRQGAWVDGRFVDEMRFGLLADEFERPD